MKVGLFGHSEGAIATEWAAEIAPDYAPNVDARMVGAAMGGVLVKPSTNLLYIDGSQLWAGVMPSALHQASRWSRSESGCAAGENPLRCVKERRRA